MPPDQDFPYSTNQLAYALKLLTDHPELCSGMDDFDKTVGDADKAPGIRDIQQQEKICKDDEEAFKKLLDSFEVENQN